MRNVKELIAAVTNLTLARVEPWQVANYGLGGYYASHFDFFTNDVRIIFKILSSNCGFIIFSKFRKCLRK